MNPWLSLSHSRYTIRLLVYTECYVRENGQDYSGTVNTTNDGRTCDYWSNHHFNEPSNYCRNVDGTLGGPWCFTSGGGVTSNVLCGVIRPIDPASGTCKPGKFQVSKLIAVCNCVLQSPKFRIHFLWVFGNTRPAADLEVGFFGR